MASLIYYTADCWHDSNGKRAKAPEKSNDRLEASHMLWLVMKTTQKRQHTRKSETSVSKHTGWRQAFTDYFYRAAKYISTAVTP